MSANIPQSTEAITTTQVTGGDPQHEERVITRSYLDIPMLTVTTMSSYVARPTALDEQKFRRLADRWRKETRRISSLSKIAVHPDYQKIIGMGLTAVPLILQEMVDRGGHWLWALHAITDEDPAPENATFSEAVTAWIEWGKSHDYLT